MRAISCSLACVIALLVGSKPARACGGGFGDGLQIKPGQKIVVAHKAGVQTYVFSPQFCGAAASFGLLLPIPAALTKNPALVDKKLFEELEGLSAPKVVREPRCKGWHPDAGLGIAPPGRDMGAKPVTVIDRGQVGIFDWVLLKAETTKAFTDWLDANKFPYTSSALDAFAHYVAAGWHFVAFKVTADSKAPGGGAQLCGDLGPIGLSFSAATPIIPARIATTSESTYFGWRVFAIAAQQLRTNSVPAMLRFSGSLSASQLTAAPTLAAVAAAGDRLTKIDLSFYSSNLSGDIELSVDPKPADFRQTITETYEIDCDNVVKTDSGVPLLNDAGQPTLKADKGGGCAVGRGGASSMALVVLSLLVLVLGRVRSRRS